MSLRRSSASILVLSVIALLSSPAFCGDQFRPATPEELKMTSEPLAPGAPAVILFRQVDRDDTGIQSFESTYVRIKILTEAGRKYGDVEIPYFKGDGSEVTRVKARTIRPDGTIVDFAGKPFDKQIVKAKGVRYMAKTFTLPDVSVGSIIEYSYYTNFPEYSLYNSRWIISDELFTKEASFSLKPYGQMSVRWLWHLLPPGTDPPKAEGSEQIIRLTVKNVPAFPTEDYMPPENELKSRVDFTYSSFSVDVHKPEQYWKETGKRLNSNTESFVSKRGAMQQAVSQIVAPNDTPEQKLEKIYARVQQLRNTSFEVRKTEQEQKRAKEKDADNVEDVWKRGAGNGAQLTWLFLGLARAAGLDAYGVMVSDRRNYFFNAGSLDENRLNTNVVLVKLNGKDLYFDPGAAYTPFGMLPWDETGVVGLLLGKDGGQWITTPIPDSSESRVEHKAEMKLDEDGTLDGVVTVTLTGLEASSARIDERNEDETARKKFLEDSLAEDIPVGAKIELTGQPDWKSSSPAFTSVYKVKIEGWVSGAGRRGFFPMGIFSNSEKHVFDHAERVHPIYFSYPFERRDDINIVLPLGMEVASVPAPVVQKGGAFIDFETKADKTASTLHLTRDLKIDGLLLDSKYYSALRTFFQAVRTGDEQQIVLQQMGVRSAN
ncbi:MAG: DUF3857 domain-containing protein [Terriglobales bacterium]